MSNLAILFISLTCFFAHAGKGSSQDLSPLEIDHRLADDPVALQRESVLSLQKLTPEENPRAWVLMQSIRMRALQALENSDALQRGQVDMEKAIELGRANGQWDEVVSLLDLRGQILERKKDIPAARSVYQEAMNLAEAHQLLSRQVESLLLYADFLLTFGESEKGVTYFKNVQNLIKDRPDLDPITYHKARVHIAVIFDQEGMSEKTLPVFQDALAFFAQKKLRHRQSFMHYDFAWMYLNGGMKDQDGRKNAIPHLLEAARLSQEIGDASTASRCLSALSDIHRLNGESAKAEVFASQAAAIMKNLDPAFYALVLGQLAKAQFDGKKNEAALATLRLAEKSFPEGSTALKNDLLVFEDEIYSQLGLWPEAYRSLAQIHRQYKATNEAKQESAFSKLKVELGLDFEEQKNTLLQRELTAARKLNFAAIGLMVLALALLLSMGFALRRSREADKANKKLRDILEIIDEGILTIGPDQTIHDEYSPYLRRLFGREEGFTGLDFADDLLKQAVIDPESRSIMREVISLCLGEYELNWLLNENHLPREITMETQPPRVLALHWQPVYSKDARINRLLLSIRDVTEQKRLAMQFAQERDRQDRLERKTMEILGSRSPDVRRFILDLKDELPRILRTSDLRRLHTIKGVARSLGFKELSRASHVLEDAILKFAPETPERAQATQSFEGQLHEYCHLLEHVLAKSAQVEGKASLFHLVEDLMLDIEQRAQSAELPIQSVNILDEVRDWSGPQIEVLREILIHALSNALDHGFLLPRQRQVQVAPVRLEVVARRLSQDLELLIRDNGVGLNWDKLQELAQRLRFVPDAGGTVADIVFLDGVSTSDQTSETSGRGVGLPRVQELCRSLGGLARLQSHTSQAGTQLSVRIPWQTFSGLHRVQAS